MCNNVNATMLCNLLLSCGPVPYVKFKTRLGQTLDNIFSNISLDSINVKSFDRSISGQIGMVPGLSANIDKCNKIQILGP